MKRRTRALAIGCALSLLVTACGDDDDTTSGDSGGEQAAGGDLDEFCALMEELDSAEAPPTAEQMEQAKDLRPDEIGDAIDYVADALIAADGDIGAVFSDPEIESEFEAIDGYLAENCPGMEDLAGDDEGGEIDPEFAAYCEASAEMDEGGGPPSAEQIRELISLAPEAIAEEASVVEDALDANDDDAEAIFEDPAVGTAVSAIEAWESENCGGGDDGDDGDVEAADGATVVPVVGVDFGFEEVPENIAAGPVALEFTNEGEAVHELALFSLADKTVEQVISDTEAAFEADDEGAIEDLGYAFRPPGGDARYINADLEAGEYVLICFIPGPEGKPHHELGMQQTFTVG